MVKSIGLLVMVVSAGLAQESTFPAERIREQTRFLSSDLMEDAAWGSGAGNWLPKYIASQLALAGPNRLETTAPISSACRWQG